jgi:hypothetical protein
MTLLFSSSFIFITLFKRVGGKQIGKKEQLFLYFGLLSAQPRVVFLSLK